MLRRPVLIAVCACIVGSVGCDGSGRFGKSIAPDPPPLTMVTIEVGGRVVNADAGGPIGNVQVSVSALSSRAAGFMSGGAYAKEIATSAGDGTFALLLSLPSDWTMVSLKFTGPAGYDDAGGRVDPTAAQCAIGPCWTAADRPEIRMYPTLVIRPGESIDVRVDGSIVWCGWDAYACRRVLVAGSSGDPVELEVVSQDSSRPMALGLANLANPFILEPDLSVRRLMVPPGAVPYVIGEYTTGTATLTARR